MFRRTWVIWTQQYFTMVNFLMSWCVQETDWLNATHNTWFGRLCAPQWRGNVYHTVNTSVKIWCGMYWQNVTTGRHATATSEGAPYTKKATIRSSSVVILCTTTLNTKKNSAFHPQSVLTYFVCFLNNLLLQNCPLSLYNGDNLFSVR